MPRSDCSTLHGMNPSLKKELTLTRSLLFIMRAKRKRVVMFLNKYKTKFDIHSTDHAKKVENSSKNSIFLSDGLLKNFQ